MGSLNITIDKMVLYVILAFIGIGLAISITLLAWVIWRVKRINLDPGADVLTALRATPLSVALLLDFLDFSLDFLSAPFAWAILTRLGLGPLRTVAVIRALIPLTQFIPAMTIAWILARVLPIRELPRSSEFLLSNKNKQAPS